MWPWGSAIACTVRRSEQLLHSLQGFKGFKVLRVSVQGLANGRLGPPLRVVKVLRVLRVLRVLEV